MRRLMALDETELLHFSFLILHPSVSPDFLWFLFQTSLWRHIPYLPFPIFYRVLCFDSLVIIFSYFRFSLVSFFIWLIFPHPITFSSFPSSVVSQVLYLSILYSYVCIYISSIENLFIIFFPSLHLGFFLSRFTVCFPIQSSFKSCLRFSMHSLFVLISRLLYFHI